MISQQQSSNHHIPQTLPKQLEKSQTLGHFSKHNRQKDTKRNTRGEGKERKEAEDKWDKLREKVSKLRNRG